MDWGKAKGHRTGDNPCDWAVLKHSLGTPSAVSPVQHHPALDYKELPEFYKKLPNVVGIAPLALQFLILTACRTTEVTDATWDEIDFENKLWTIRPERRKGRKGRKREPMPL